MEPQKILNSQSVLRPNNKKVEDITHSGFKLYYKAIFKKWHGIDKNRFMG